MDNIQQYIHIDKNVRFGKPTIIGTRITVADVLNWMASGMSFADIILDFPELNTDQLKACCAYAAKKEDNLRVA
jgi:uncharacterized protein (DUF433 family)